LEVSELSQLGLERGKTAREAIEIMGALAEKYGYYGAEWNTESGNLQMIMGEAGEALSVVDPNEAWMFHILPDDTGASAVWVAQKLPDDHVSACANAFVIRKIDPNDKNILFSSNLWDVAKRAGFWDESMGLLDFAPTFAPARFHPEYATRRIWRVLSLACPSCNFPGDTDAWGNDYPFSVKVDKKLTVHDIIAMNRDHYEGTKYSTGENAPGGPYGEVNRWDPAVTPDMPMELLTSGGFERTISLFRTSYSFVTQARKNTDNIFAKFWFGQYAPDSTGYGPIYVQTKELPKAYITGAMHRYNPESAYWASCVVGNWANRFYNKAMEMVRPLQIPVEIETEAATKELEHKLAAKLHRDDDKETRMAIIDELTDFTHGHSRKLLQMFNDLLPDLMTTFRDGYHVLTEGVFVTPQRLFYPQWWLESVGFFNNPGVPGGIYFLPSPEKISTFGSSFFIASLFFAVGFFAARKYQPSNRRSEYAPIDLA